MLLSVPAVEKAPCVHCVQGYLCSTLCLSTNGAPPKSYLDPPLEIPLYNRHVETSERFLAAVHVAMQLAIYVCSYISIDYRYGLSIAMYLIII